MITLWKCKLHLKLNKKGNGNLRLIFLTNDKYEYLLTNTVRELKDILWSSFSMQGFKKERRESLHAIAFYNGDVITCLLPNVQTMQIVYSLSPFGWCSYVGFEFRPRIIGINSGIKLTHSITSGPLSIGFDYFCSHIAIISTTLGYLEFNSPPKD